MLLKPAGPQDHAETCNFIAVWDACMVAHNNTSLGGAVKAKDAWTRRNVLEHELRGFFVGICQRIQGIGIGEPASFA